MSDIDRAVELLKLIKKMSNIDKERTLLALMLLNSSIIGKLDQLNDELSTVNVEQILDKLGPEFRSKYKI